MKSKKNTIAVIIAFILVVISVLFFRYFTHTFSSFLIDDSGVINFYPEGMANRYKTITLLSPNEDQRVWKFDLSNQEANDVNINISNGCWQPISVDGLKYVYKIYFAECIFNYRDSDEIYYCLFDLDKGDYKSIDINNNLLFGQENLLFIYNKTTSEYYCVVKITH